MNRSDIQSVSQQPVGDAAASRLRARSLRLAGLAGILAPIFTLALIFISVALSPWFEWHFNALSDMGVSATPNPFNEALLIGGIIYLGFVCGFVGWHGIQSALAQIAAMCLIVGGVGLVLIGVITEDAGRIHYVVAGAYFFITPLAYLLYGFDLIRRGRPLPGLLTLMAGLVAFIMIILVPHKGVAVPEILAATILSAWTVSMGLKMLFEPAPFTGKERHEQTS